MEKFDGGDQLQLIPSTIQECELHKDLRNKVWVIENWEFEKQAIRAIRLS